VYPFDEGNGATTADFSGLGNNGTLNSSVGWTAAGKYGNALSFGGGYVDLGNPGALQLTGSMTISAWIYSTSFPVDDAAIVSKLIEKPGPGWQLDTTVDLGPRTVGFKLANPSGALMARYGATTLQLNQWYHVAGVYDAQAQTLTVYLNGQVDNGALVGTVTPTQLDALINVNIGKRPSLNGYEFSGTIDDVRIYNRALNQAEIQADMAVPASAPPPDTTPPTAPGSLSATATNAAQINLSWTASTDNVGVTNYQLERCQGAGCSAFVQIATPVTTVFSDTGLQGATSYSYRVRAADVAGNLSTYSNVGSATTPSAQAQMYFIEPDHLNTPRMIATSTGTTVWKWDQTEPFGDSLPSTDPDGDGIAFDFPLRFPGQYADKETGTFYNVARDYWPNGGRYIQSDPIGLAGGINTYRYVSGNPLVYMDAFGLLSPVGTAGEIMMVFGGGAAIVGAGTPFTWIGGGVFVVGAVLVIWDYSQTINETQKIVDPMREKIENEYKQNEIDKLFPPKEPIPACP
jgi:RHS repeat-associated protein